MRNIYIYGGCKMKNYRLYMIISILCNFIALWLFTCKIIIDKTTNTSTIMSIYWTLVVIGVVSLIIAFVKKFRRR